MARQPFTIAYAQETEKHLQVIEPKYVTLIRTTIEEQLRFEPSRQTRNRKRLNRPTRFTADWELRFGPQNRFRALYQIDVESQVVWVRAIGIKERNRLFIGGKEVDL
jgi:hypothetical protein